MAADRLAIYQMALRLLGDIRLATLGDTVTARYALDDAWDRAPTFVLRQAPWRFALNTLALVSSGLPPPGYTASYSLPAKWLRTHAIFLSGTGGREFPIDLRDQGGLIWTNTTVAPVIRFINSDYIDPAFAPWPEHFAECVAIYLAFLAADKIQPGSAGKMSQLFSEFLPEAKALDAIEEDPWLPHQRDGSFLRVARTMIDEAYWRFSLRTALVSAPGGTPEGGFANAFPIPADWSRTRSLYVLTTAQAPTGAGERRPFKIREHAGHWHTDVASFYAEYVSQTLAMDSTHWPDHYMRSVLRQIEFDKQVRKDSASQPATYGRDAQQRADVAWQEALADTVDSEADAGDPWLAHQLDGSFELASRAVISRGFWWWGLKEIQYDTSQQKTTRGDYGLPYRYGLPADWLRTHSLFVPWDGLECPINIRESNNDWSTDTGTFVARYLSTDVLNPQTWPEALAQAVLAYLDADDDTVRRGAKETPPAKEQIEAAEFDKMLAAAFAIYSQTEDPWLRHQLDGKYIDAVKMALERGRWRFAVKTVTLSDPNNPSAISLNPLANPPQHPVPGNPNAFGDGSVSPGYGCRMPKPGDWLRTIRLYFSMLDGTRPIWYDVDFRDELGAVHTNYTPVVMRYISRLGLDSTQWPHNFRDAVLTLLEFMEIRRDPRMAAAAKAKFEIFEAACIEAQNLDDETDMPKVVQGGRFVAGRFGRGTLSLENAIPPFLPL